MEQDLMELNEGQVENVGALTEASGDDIRALVAQSQGEYANEKALAEVTKVGDWLPYIQLMGGETKEVKRGDFPVGHFALRKQRQLIDIGKEFVAMFIAWRPKAMAFGPPPVAFFNPATEQFRTIQLKADTPNSGCGFGPEFLVWLPEHKEFCNYFLGNKTGRNEAPNMVALIKDGKMVGKVSSVFIEPAGSKYSWHGPRVQKYDLSVTMPPIDKLRDVLEKFNNPPESVKEPAEGTDDRR